MIPEKCHDGRHAKIPIGSNDFAWRRPAGRLFVVETGLTGIGDFRDHACVIHDIRCHDHIDRFYNEHPFDNEHSPGIQHNDRKYFDNLSPRRSSTAVATKWPWASIVW